ncbi:MAG: YdcF family protein [Coleofasciculus sp. Co-bin14]|nr:YdcF family protein [Coleofasciculus sp. Co-bin14]
MKSVKSPLKIKRSQRILSRVALMALITAIVAIGHLAVSIYFYNSPQIPAQADAAIVLGAEVWGEEPSPVFRERINHGINLYKKQRVNKIIFTGGQGDGYVQTEAMVAKKYAIRQGVLELDILTETQSRTTYQNLYYAQQVAQKHQLSQFFIVSDPLHMKRAMLMAQGLGMKAYPSPTPTTKYKSLNNKLPFLLRETYFSIHYLISRLLPSVYKT